MAKTLTDLRADNPVNNLTGAELVEVTRGANSGATTTGEIAKMPVPTVALTDMPASPAEGRLIYVPDHHDGPKFFGSTSAGWVDLTPEGGGPVEPAPMPVRNYTTAISFGEDDLGAFLRINSAANVVATMPTSLGAVGDQIHVRAIGGGQITIAGAVGVTITSPETLKLRKQHSTATLVCVAANVWDLMGDLEPLP